MTLKEFLFRYPEIIFDNYNLVKNNGKSVLDIMINYSSLKSDVMDIEREIPGLNGLYETFSKINAKDGVRPAGKIGEL
ncbi:hypothetical protein DFP83_11439 [Idiomarina fontislapidosi]|uniref:Uncharacterized protein n=1 Tax=Idiomarina fontislapidosi TaxID=263723 RepID=A0A432XQY8_9GAMM|nr:hypothetical protein [Idiomarina fontislapidosi]PYE30723.1 hypothetical protein DFP83_11439 [Idiomarina fontislapidosi]RUO51110.1 hypothetical protein CWE25_11925 [Idiomarina fontislapidosi]